MSQPVFVCVFVVFVSVASFRIQLRLALCALSFARPRRVCVLCLCVVCVRYVCALKTRSLPAVATAALEPPTVNLAPDAEAAFRQVVGELDQWGRFFKQLV